MSKTKETKPMSNPEADRRAEAYRKSLEKDQRIVSATDKAYQVFIEHGLDFEDVEYVMRRLVNRIDKAKLRSILS